MLNILRQFNMIDCSSIGTPLEVNFKLIKVEAMLNVLDALEVGAIGYVSVTTCLALTYAVGEVNQYSVNVGQCHWYAIKRISGYLKGTFDHGITYGHNSNASNIPTILEEYIDADWTVDIDGRKSASSFAFIVADGFVVGIISNNKLLHYQVLKLSTLLQGRLVKKEYGFDNCYKTLVLCKVYLQ